LASERGPSGFKILLFVVVVAIVRSLITVWLTTTYLFPWEFQPVKLNDREGGYILNLLTPKIPPNCFLAAGMGRPS
jgi:hypothetical protein